MSDTSSSQGAAVFCKTVSFLFRVLLFILLLAPVSGMASSDPPEDPILRIETGMHTATIRRISIDAAERMLVTASKDKTLRIWDLATGDLIRTLRVPSGTGDNGMLYSCALSPDGKTVATGGWDWNDTIYLFDLASGRIRHRITGLSNVIFHLAFSRDGRHLAATLGGSNGVRVYNTNDWSLTAKDTDYGGRSYGMDFSRSGRMVTVCKDGFIRLYDSRFKLVAKKKAPGGKEPFSAIFSPDGSQIAVGFQDSTKVDVLSATDLSHRFSPDTEGVDDEISSVAWSLDGKQLYAGGMYDDSSGTNPIRKWSAGGKGTFIDMPASNNTIMHMLPLSGNRLVYGATDPVWGVLDTTGRKVLFKEPVIPDYSNNLKGFRVSHDGSRVQFGFKSWGKQPAVFDVSTRTLTLVKKGSPDPGGLSAPVTDTLEITNWKNKYGPTINGKKLSLKKYEMSRRLAIAPGGSSFVLGTEWNIRSFSKTGSQLWQMPVQDVCWGVNVSGDGKTVVAAVSDGTINWYRLKDGQKLLTLFPEQGGKRWVLWSSSGYYAAPAGSDNLIGWHVNRGKDKVPDFFPTSQFRSVYYRPDVTELVLAAGSEEEAIRLADEQAGRKQKEIEIRKMLPPVVTLISPADRMQVSSQDITVKYAIRTPSGEPVTSVKVLIDGRPVADRGNTSTRSGEIAVKLPQRNCTVSVIAENRYTASTPAAADLVWVSKNEEFVIKPKLYLLSIGVGRYEDARLNLDYPGKDARDFSAVFKKQGGTLYREVVSRVVTDQKATKDSVLDGLEWIERETTDKDIAVMFLAGHGVNDRNGNYHFLPADGDPERLKRTGVSYATIRDTFSGLPGKVLVFLDTCHSGNIMGGKRRGGMADIDKVVNDLASAENGVIVFASSTGRQFSMESPSWGNGAFTKALVEGLAGGADYSRGKGIVTVNMLDLFISERVKELTDGQQTPTTAKPSTIPDFPIAMQSGE